MAAYPAPVAAEFRGWARHLRRQVEHAEEQFFSSLVDVRRAVRGSTGDARAALIEEAARTWPQRGPRFGRLALDIEHTRRTLRINETRLHPTTYADPGWRQPEPVIAVAQMVLTMRRHQYDSTFTSDISALASLHSLARRFERVGVDEDGVIADLGVLGRLPIAAGRVTDFACPVPSGGCWAGYTLAAEHQGQQIRLRVARTFLSEGMVAR